ncbi:hypothetical protein V2A60_009875 [Cordyceps javanica]
MKLSTSLVGATAAALFSVQTAADGLSISSDSDIKATAETVAKRLLRFYKGDEEGAIPGILPGPPATGAGDYYWWSASAVWASLVDYWHFTGDGAHNDVVMRALLFQAGDGGDYMPANQTAAMGNDDQGFWGIAAMTAAERNFPNPPRDGPQWLGLAQRVFRDLAGRWDAETCGGGLRWQILSMNKGWDYKNGKSFIPVLTNKAASAGVLMSLGARLSRYTGNSTFGDWSDKVWDWAEHTGLINNGTVYDGAHPSDNCSDISKIEFSYNSGLFALGAACMLNTTGDTKWKDRLDSVVSHGLEVFFKDGGAAREVACETVGGGGGRCTSDMTFFKGIYVQMLAAAAQVSPHIAETVLPALNRSAAAAVRSCAGSSANDDACGLDWTTTGGKAADGKGNAGSTCSVLSSVVSLLAGAGDAPYTAKTGGTSSGGNGGNSGNSSGGDGGGGAGGGGGSRPSASTGGGAGGSGGDDKKGAAGKTSGSITLGLMMTCIAILLL